MRIRLTQIDGKLPNLALMKLAHWYKARNDKVRFTKHIERDLEDASGYDRVYGSAIFSFSANRVEKFRSEFPEAIIGGTYNTTDNRTVEQLIGADEYEHYDYSDFEFDASIGFTQRGCRLKCGFCVVPKKEGKPRSVNTIDQIWRGALTAADRERLKPRRAKALKALELTRKTDRANLNKDQLKAFLKRLAAAEANFDEVDKILTNNEWPKHIHLLDNDFFGDEQGKSWKERIAEIRKGKFKVCFNQGINTRMIDDESAEALGSIALFDDSFKTRRLYTAWDNLKDEERFFTGVDTLERHGIKPYCLLVYMLVGFAKGETWERVLHRFRRMTERKIRPYPMIYGEKKRGLPLGNASERLRHRTLAEFQRWAIRKYYTVVSFEDYDGSATEKLVKTEAGYRPML